MEWEMNRDNSNLEKASFLGNNSSILSSKDLRYAGNNISLKEE